MSWYSIASRVRQNRPASVLVGGLTMLVGLTASATPAVQAQEPTTRAADPTCNNVLQPLPNYDIRNFEACASVRFTPDKWSSGNFYVDGVVTVRRAEASEGSPDVTINVRDIQLYQGWNAANSEWQVVRRSGSLQGTNSINWSVTHGSVSPSAGRAYRTCVVWQAADLGDQITCTKAVPLT
ncbi:hypothetical protein GCM10010191_55490 [Actinomadura vinacea]|uniref:Secreted protein n=2 Tax=Actinomadura vinacea TaxID=115336 RepID=A0ABN3JM27_9ACTN